jgi:3-dehydrosphinganine reductase
MKNYFLDKNIIITGGSSGIGFALAKECIDFGAKVWILGRDENKLQQAKLNINSDSLNIIAADVTKLDQLQIAFDHFEKNNLIVDYLINSAGVTHPGEFEKLDINIFQWMMDINYFGTVYMIKTFLPLMKTGSTIVNISSMAAIMGVYGYTAYGASKYAVRGFSDTLRSELKIKGINVSIVYPPDTETPQLDYDNQYKPAITKELSSNAGLLTADKVAHSIIIGIKRKQYMIFPGLEGNILYFATNILGGLTYPIMDIFVSSAIKKINNQNK